MLAPMGIDLRTKERVMIPLLAHLICFGRTGSGKSSLVLDRCLRAAISEFLTTIVFDGGADPALFTLTLILARAAGRQVVLLSDRPGLRSSRIDPFRASGQLSLIDAVNLVVAAAGIDSSLSYGPFYFWVSSVEGLLTIWRQMERRGIPIALDTTVDFIEAQRGQRRRGRDDTEQLKRVISVLLGFEHVIQMDRDPSECGFVRWREIEESETVVYVAFQSMDSTSIIFANTIFHSFLAYKRECTWQGTNDYDAILIMDEFQRLMSAQLAENLAGMRRNNVTFKLFAQSTSQLRIVSKDLANILLEQNTLQLFLTPDSEEDQKYLQNHSEEVIRVLGSATRSFINPNTGEREYVTRRLTVNEIRQAAAMRNVAILVKRLKEEGPEEPRIIYLEHLVSKETHELLTSQPFPKKLPALQPPAPVHPDPTPQMINLFNQVRGRLNGY